MTLDEAITRIDEELSRIRTQEDAEVYDLTDEEALWVAERRWSLRIAWTRIKGTLDAWTERHGGAGLRAAPSPCEEDQ